MAERARDDAFADIPVEALPVAPAQAPIGRGARPWVRIEPMPPGKVILLSIATGGLYGLRAFYRAVRSYENAVPEYPSQFRRRFWSWLGSSLAGVAAAIAIPAGGLLFGGAGAGVALLGFLGAFIGQQVLANLTLREALDARDAAVATLGLGELPFSSSAQQVRLYTLGQLLVPASSLFMLRQSVLFFEDHTLLAEACGPPER